MKVRPLLFWLLIAFTGHANAESYLDGLWTGAYDYGSELSDKAIWCAIVFETTGDEIKGRLIEVQTFGREPSVGLSADLKGVASDGMISLVKKYDGSGGQTHAVHLRLSYNADHTLSGEWVLNEQTKGTIHLAKMQFDPNDMADEEGWEE